MRFPAQEIKSNLATQEICFIEFFSGDGEVWRAIRLDDVTAARLDIKFIESIHGDGDNPMDINTMSGMGFPISMIKCRLI